MRVALIALHYSEYTARLAMALAARHDVQLHLSAFNAANELLPDFVARLRASGVDLRLHPRPARKSMLLDGWRIGRAIAAFRPDVVHCQEAAGWSTLAALMIGARGVPMVLTVHDPVPHTGEDILARSRAAWAVRQLRARARDIIVHGEALVQDMAGAGASPRAKIHAVAHGILGDFTPVPALPAAPAFLFFGRIQAYKGLGVLLDALDLLAARGLHPDLLIAGSGPDLEQYRTRIAAMPNIRLDDRFLPVEDIPPLFVAASCIVMPYTEATQSGVAAFALSAGRPVIVSQVGAITEVIRNEHNGLLVPPRNPEALAQAMARVLSEDGLLAHLSAGAQETAAGLLDWNRIALQTAQIYAGT